MRKIRESMKLVVLLAGAGGLVWFGCSSGDSTPGPVGTAGTTGGGAGMSGGGFQNPGGTNTDGGAVGGMGGGLGLGNKDGGGSAQGGFGGLTFGGRGGSPATGGMTGTAGSGPGGAPGTGGSGPPPGTGGMVGTNVAINDYANAFAQTVCARMGECCGGVPAGCVMTLTQSIGEIVTAYTPSINAGKIGYRGDKVAACLTTLKLASCTTFKVGSTTTNVFRDCDAAFEPKVPVGGACEDSVECLGGWCAAQGMTCMARFPNGSQCLDDPHCQSDFCDETSMTCTTAPQTTPMLCPAGMMPAPPPGPMP